MIWRVNLFLSLLILLSCQNDHQEDVSFAYPALDEFNYAFLDILPNDTLEASSDHSPICFNFNPDSLQRLKAPDSHFLQFVDLTNKFVLINWHLFLGEINVKKIDNTSYEFIGRANFPKNGNWKIPFENKKFIRYVIHFSRKGNSKYLLYRDKTVHPELIYDEKKLKVLKNEIFSDENCLSYNWELAIPCFNKVKEYEFHLFAALLSGEEKYKTDYLGLRDEISISNAGEFSEYLSGNTMILVMHGILTNEDLQSRKRLWRNLQEEYLKTECLYCFN